MRAEFGCSPRLQLCLLFSFLKRKDIPKLSEQRSVVQDGMVPFPLYTCVHVKKNVSAQAFCGKIICVNFTLGPVFIGIKKIRLHEWFHPESSKQKSSPRVEVGVDLSRTKRTQNSGGSGPTYEILFFICFFLQLVYSK